MSEGRGVYREFAGAKQGNEVIGLSLSFAAATVEGRAWPFVAGGSRVHSQNPICHLRLGSGMLGPHGVGATAVQGPLLGDSVRG